MTSNAFRNQLAQMAQLGQATGVQVAAIYEHVEDNIYTAQPMEFSDAGGLSAAGDAELLTVTNLAEPADIGGLVAPGTPVAAIDVEGRWVVHARPNSQLSFVAKVTSRNGPVYAVEMMDPTGSSTFQTRSQTVNATNVRELDGVSSAGVGIGSYVIVTVVQAESAPATIAYVFSVEERAPLS